VLFAVPAFPVNEMKNRNRVLDACSSVLFFKMRTADILPSFLAGSQNAEFGLELLFLTAGHTLTT
jgi:hypothetical protein